MKLWRVAPFFSLTFGEVCYLKREEAASLLFSFQITNLTKSEWKKRGNSSEFHSERNYYLQNWYFSWLGIIQKECSRYQLTGNNLYTIWTSFSRPMAEATSHWLKNCNNIWFEDLYQNKGLFCHFRFRICESRTRLVSHLKDWLLVSKRVPGIAIFLKIYL